MSSYTPQRFPVRAMLTREEKRQLEMIAQHYSMYEKDVIVSLIRREALRISK